jgi:hypothetical protein
LRPIKTEGASEIRTMCYVVAWLHERHQMGVNQRGEAMKSTRRHHGATVKGDKTLAELAEQFRIPPHPEHRRGAALAGAGR